MSSTATTERERPATSTARRWFVEPQTDGPRVRLGVLWFLLTMAAVSSGRWWTAGIMAVSAAVAAFQAARVWVRAMEPGARRGRATGPGVVAGAAAAVVTLTAGYGTGAVGLAFVVVGVLGGLLVLGARSSDGPPAPGAAVPIAMVLPTVAAVSVVLAVRLDLWGGVFLVAAVSLYDAGSYLLGAEASGRWEGPVAGIIGALAVTFTVATVKIGAFDRAEWWLLGAVVAGTAVLGQSIVTAFLPSPDASVPGLRRLDAYVVAGPAFVACGWALT